MNEISKQLTERKNDSVTEISNTFDELEKALHQRKTALITEVENICSTKQKVSDLIHFKFDAFKKKKIMIALLTFSIFLGASNSAYLFASGQREHSE